MPALDPRFHVHTLDNGLSVLFEQMTGVPSAAAGFLVKTGARDETPEMQGVSHFLEHMMFKGTASRDAAKINIDFDEMGASYNAFTSNERTFYYGWVPSGELSKLLDLLSDMMRSALPPREFDMEKKVILEEIAMYEDSLEMHTFEMLMEHAFAGHPLAGSVLGSNDTVGALTREQMEAYFQRRYAPENMLLVVTGKFDEDETLRNIGALCGAWQQGDAVRSQERPTARAGRHVLEKDRFQRQTLCLAYDAPSAAEQDADVADLAARVLGKADNSRLFWNITQKGLAEGAHAFHYDFTDTGLFVLYAVTQPDKARTVLDALRAEAAAFAQEGPTGDEVSKSRNQLKTGFALQAEVPFNRLLQIAGDLEILGRPRTPEERIADYDRISVDGVNQYLEAYPITGEGTLVSVGPLVSL